MYQRLLTKTAPPGVAGFNWKESMALFTQGRAAMWLDGIGLAPPLEDPNASRVVGKVGYGVMPAGPKGQYSADLRRRHRHYRRRARRRKPPISTANGRFEEMGARLLQSGGGVPFRNSILNDEAVRNGVKMPPEWLHSVDRLGQDRQARPAGDRSGHRVPRHLRRRAHRNMSGRRPGDRAEEGDRPVPAGPGAQREGVSETRARASRPGSAGPADATGAERAWRPPVVSGPSSCRRWSSFSRSSSFPWVSRSG